MATATANVTVNNETYAALSSSSTSCMVWVKRGQMLRINIGGSAPSDDDTAVYALISGPAANEDGVGKFHTFTLSSANVYARLQLGDTTVTVITT